MGPVRSLMILLGVLVSCLALLVPFLALEVPLQGEAWMLQAIGELHRNPGLIPTLNGVPLDGPNPLVQATLSLLPAVDLAALRMVGILLGCLVSLSVFLFCASLWDARSGILAALVTMTSWGFIAGHALLNPTVVPASLAILAFLLFAEIYLKEHGPRWYLLSYFLVGAAVLTGGWIPLGFFVLGVIGLILLDLSPRRLLSIQAPMGILIIAGMIVAAILAAWIAVGWSYAASLFSSDSSHGIAERLWIWVKPLLPWVLLVIPAWVYGGRPQEPHLWRGLLAPKVGLCMGLLTVLFSPNLQEGYAILGVPFAGILIGYWAAGGFLIPEKLRALRTLTVSATAAILVAGACVYLYAEPIRNLSLNLAQIPALLVLLAAGGLAWWLARSRRTAAVIGLCMVVVFGLSWYTALVHLPERASGLVNYVRQISSFSPLLVYRSDLAMRGYLGYAGARPAVVSEAVVPIGGPAYLAVKTDDLESLVEGLSTRMNAEVVRSFHERGAYALIRISPAFTRQTP